MRKVIPGQNDFETWCINNNCTEMLFEWDYEKNDILPSEVAFGSGKKYWWIGHKCGHSYMASLNKRTSDGTGCPYCCESHAKLLPGFNDLATTNPELLFYWDYEKNGDLLPRDVMKGQHRKVWWTANCGHSWQATIYHMSNGRRCPICRKESQTSFQEQAIFYYVKKYFQDAEIDNREVLNGKELDIYIPSIKVGVEFDGSAWHKDSQKDNIKNTICRDSNITLYRIRDVDCPELEKCDGIIIIEHEKYTNECLTICIQTLLSYLNIFEIVNLNADGSAILSQYLSRKISNSLEEMYPEIADEWDYEKNGGLSPQMVSSSSGKKVWWNGKCGHSWQATVASRVNAKANCPYCNSNRLLSGYNDLETTNPELLKYWDYEKNTILPSQIKKTSTKKIFWKCDKCHSSYLQSVVGRIKSDGCIICNDGNVSKRKRYKQANNTIDNTDQYLLQYWDYEKNEIKPSEITRGSDKPIWWKCDNNHSFKMSIPNRLRYDICCPYCSNRKLLIGFNDLETTNPELLDYWDYSKNDLKPNEVMRNSRKKIWWICKNGHSHLSYLYSYRPNACPICIGRKKVIIKIETGEEYNSFSDAAKSCNLTSGNTISLCCKGIQKTAGGFHWKIKD